MFQNNCTAGGLNIAIRCRRKSGSIKNTSAERDKCCLLRYRKKATTFQASKIPRFCHQEEVQTNESEILPEFRRIAEGESVHVVSSECISYELHACEGDEVHLLCTCSSCPGPNNKKRKYVDWWSSNQLQVSGPSFIIPNVQRRDTADYVCRRRSLSKGKTVAPATVRFVVQHPPLIVAVPKGVWSNKNEETVRIRLECDVQAFPPATITWYKDVDGSSGGSSNITTYSLRSSVVSNCTTRSFLEFYVSLNASTSTLRGNYTCAATNPFGSTYRVLSIKDLEDLEEIRSYDDRRPFNVTGFIIGMLPPLFISFYIILKLGYRSRYAEERPEDDGLREEPFFVSY